MGTIATWLASKLATPLLLALSLLLALGLVVQTVRLDGVSLFGLYAVDGYKPLYTALAAKDLQAKLDHANAVIAETSARDKALASSNTALATQLADLKAARPSYAPSEVIKYVPTEIRTACVPVSLLWLLDAAGTGADVSTAAPGPGESSSACADMGLLGAQSAVMQNVGKIAELGIRIANARGAWEAQRQIGQESGATQ